MGVRDSEQSIDADRSLDGRCLVIGLAKLLESHLLPGHFAGEVTVANRCF